jgi:hypothetical protein
MFICASRILAGEEIFARYGGFTSMLALLTTTVFDELGLMLELQGMEVCRLIHTLVSLARVVSNTVRV